MAKQIPIGISDFQKIRTGGYYYVDKSMLITDVVNSGAEVILLPRPRRFGKTLNLSMLRNFFDMDRQEGTSLFTGLAVSKQAKIMAHRGRYPTVFLTLKDVKFADYKSCLTEMALILADLFDSHMATIEKARPTRADRLVIGTLSSADPNPAMMQRSLKVLSKLLHRATGQKAIVLVDEYDAPIHAGYRHQYYEEIIGFMRNLLSGAYKDNDHLEKGVVTGILRVAIFSGFNNPRVCTLLDEEFSQHFGFTQTEVGRFLQDLNLQDRLLEVRNWYNGYRFGSHTIYNPWSIMQYATDALISSARAQAYWVNTSDNQLVRELIMDKNAIATEDLETLLAGKTLHKEVETNIVLGSLKSKDVWSMLIFSGYLKATATVKDGPFLCELAIPNLEVRTFFESTVRDWLEEQLGANGLKPLLVALLNEDMEALVRHFSELVKGVLSYHDTAGQEPERVYHAFLLGILVALRGKYRVKSNRESGFGRYDAALIPEDRARTGFIFEFKRVTDQTPEQTTKGALEQIVARDYAAELHAAGISKIRAIGVAIDGKQAWLDSKCLTES